MNKTKKALATLVIVCLYLTGYSQTCTPSNSSTELDINNVKATLLGGGDLWWDLSDGKYIVPKPPQGGNPVSTVFAAGIWIGGLDNAGNLKLAAQTYRQGGNDFWPGPILSNPVPQLTCLKWNRHFVVLGAEIDSFLQDYDDNGTIDDPIPTNILLWPASGNPNSIYGQALPIRDLAPFKDQNNDSIYNPMDGDYPILGLDGCQDQYADQMIWWVFNDVGNVHTHTSGSAIGIEVQAMAYAFVDGPLANTTFYTYDIINQSTEDLNDTYIGQWTDTDLGCWQNDFIGCDVARSMGISYNGRANDPDCSSFNSIIYGYGSQVPLFGIDLLKGPKDSSGQSLPMTSFVSYNNDNSPVGNPATDQEYYQYLKGQWRNGSPLEFGGDGYLENTFPFPYMFPGVSADTNDWSECTEFNTPGDRKMLMGSGPFDFPAGSRNEFTIAAIFVPNVPHPCPNFAPLEMSSDSIQALFDNCFSPMVTSIEPVIPEVLEASRVYPNPTNVSQGVHITNVPANAILEITAIDGKRLYTKQQKSGITTDLFWDLTTDNGGFVTGGLYFVSIRLEGIGSRVFKVSVY